MKRTAWNGCDEIQDEKGYEAENILAAWWQRCCKRFRRCSRIRSGPEFSCSLTVLSPDTWRRERWPDSCTDANHNWSLGFQVGIVFFCASAKVTAKVKDDKWRISKTDSNYSDTMLIAAIQWERLWHWMNPQVWMGRISCYSTREKRIRMKKEGK